MLGEVRTYFAEARSNSNLPHVVLPLRSRFKGKTGDLSFCGVGGGEQFGPGDWTLD